MTIEFFVPGNPVQQGSLRGFVVKGRAVITADNKAPLRNWRASVQQAAADAVPEPLSGPIEIGARFVLSRPQSAPKSRIWPDVQPDLDKLVRALLDSLTGIAFHDDKQVCRLAAVDKVYATPSGQTGAIVRIRSLVGGFPVGQEAVVPDLLVPVDSA